MSSRASTESLPLELSDAVTVWDYAVEWILGSLLVFMPVVFGVVTPADRTVVVFGAAALAVCLLAKRVLRPDVRAIWSWTYLPVLAFLLLV